MQLEFSRQFFEKYSYINVMKIPPVGADLLNADGWADMTKLTVAFRNSANAPNIG